MNMVMTLTEYTNQDNIYPPRRPDPLDRSPFFVPTRLTLIEVRYASQYREVVMARREGRDVTDLMAALETIHAAQRAAVAEKRAAIVALLG